ncbi:MAG: metallophosphoesterase family protein, partial [Planctomycetota bacterium]
MSRLRQFLLAVLLVSAVLAGAGLEHGFRYPPLQLDPAPAPLKAGGPAWSVRGEGACSAGMRDGMPVLRSFRPEPVLFLENRSPEPLRVVLENVHPEARLLATPGGLTSSWTGDHPLERILEMAGAESGSARTVRAKVFFPDRTAYTFAAIGDTGGATELKHCLDAAADLGADFLIHLGDFAYAEGQLVNAARLLREASIPVFAAIGNHDFHGGHRNRFLLFRDSIGPLDSFFSFRGVEFLNLDTAADLVPAGAGRRGTLLRQVESLRKPMQARGVLPPLVVFSHRPLVDPRTLFRHREKGHALNR